MQATQLAVFHMESHMKKWARYDEVKPQRDAVWEKMIGSVIASTGDYLESATRNGP